MVCGGSPCQDYSVAGQGKGAIWTCSDCGSRYNPLTIPWNKRDVCPKCGGSNIEKTRSSLLVEYLRVVREKKPNFGIYENVKNIVGKKFKEGFDLFTKELEEYGYNVYWKVLNAKDYGVPQNRERVYLLFIKKELDNGRFQFPDKIPLSFHIIWNYYLPKTHPFQYPMLVLADKATDIVFWNAANLRHFSDGICNGQR